MKIKKHICKLFSLIVLTTLLSSIFSWLQNVGFVNPVGAEERSLEDVIRELEKKQQEKESKEKSLSDIEKQISSLGKRSGSLQNQLAQVQADIDKVSTEIKKHEEEIAKIEQDIKIVSEGIDKKKVEITNTQKTLYQMGQITSVEVLLSSGDISSFMINHEVLVQSIDKCKDDMKKLQENIEKLNEFNRMLSEEKSNLEKQIVDLTEEQNRLKEEYADALAQLAYSKSKASELRGQIAQLQTEIDILEEEQKKILEREQQQLQQGGNGGTEPLKPGDYYFRVRGRDLYDGHGVGMSQWGAYGMAAAGKNYQQILTFYYTGTSIGQSPISSIPVEGHGNMNLEDYVSGIGEVPDKACGTPEQVAQRPDKYVVDNPESVWDCWPEESIKAQVVAARTYAIYYTRGGKAICTTAACQVYKGGDAKRWAANETVGQVVLYNGSVIGAFYHASARGHTEGNEYVWTANKYGDIGYAKPYLRGVNDSSWAYRNSYYDWVSRTNGYSLEEWSSILSTNPDTNVGTLISLSIDRGSSNRAWRVHLHGSAGDKTVAAWYFKAIYNEWVYLNKPPEQRDYIYSTEFFFLRVE